MQNETLLTFAQTTLDNTPLWAAILIGIASIDVFGLVKGKTLGRAGATLKSLLTFAVAIAAAMMLKLEPDAHTTWCVATLGFAGFMTFKQASRFFDARFDKTFATFMIMAFFTIAGVLSMQDANKVSIAEKAQALEDARVAAATSQIESLAASTTDGESTTEEVAIFLCRQTKLRPNYAHDSIVIEFVDAAGEQHEMSVRYTNIPVMEEVSAVQKLLSEAMEKDGSPIAVVAKLTRTVNAVTLEGTPVYKATSLLIRSN